MTVPVFINEIFCGLLTDGTEPLRAPRAHPDEIAGGGGIPRVAEPIDAAAFEHEQAMLHDVHFHYAERGAGLIGHRVDSEVERRLIGEETLDLEIWIVVESVRGDGVFAGDDELRRKNRVERLVGFFDDGDAAGRSRRDFMREPFRKVRKPARDERVVFACSFELNCAVENIEETLRRRWPEFTAEFEFRGVLRESCAERRADVNDGGSFAHAGKRGAHESVRREKKMVTLVRAARLTEIVQWVIHGARLSFVRKWVKRLIVEIPARQQVV